MFSVQNIPFDLGPKQLVVEVLMGKPRAQKFETTLSGLGRPLQVNPNTTVV